MVVFIDYILSRKTKKVKKKNKKTEKSFTFCLTSLNISAIIYANMKEVSHKVEQGAQNAHSIGTAKHAA